MFFNGKKCIAFALTAVVCCCSIIAPVNSSKNSLCSNYDMTVSASNSQYCVVTAKSGINVRNAPNGAKIGAASYLTECFIFETSGNWGHTRIKCADGKTREGWISLSYVTSGILEKVNTPSGVRLRTGAGTSYSKITTIPNGAYVIWNFDFKYVNGVRWDKVTYNGKTGYACASYLVSATSSGWGY